MDTNDASPPEYDPIWNDVKFLPYAAFLPARPVKFTYGDVRPQFRNQTAPEVTQPSHAAKNVTPPVHRKTVNICTPHSLWEVLPS